MFYKTYMNVLSTPLIAARLGSAVRTARLTQGTTQDALARQLGVRRQTVADLECGRNVGLHVALGALAALGLGVLPVFLAADAGAPVRTRDVSPAAAWPANWSVVDDWDDFERRSRERLDAAMRGADSGEANRREAFVLAPLNVGAARMIACPEFGDASEF
ncbi:helix-turn-helix domain protein [Burkholderia sp. BT03]|nr:helix-turn-helix domain protein [Burkholderia sp. BT03]SKC93886.1 Transcriptional regulator, contains XRE-family HTH domain [Paraburkholderia hospita]